MRFLLLFRILLLLLVPSAVHAQLSPDAERLLWLGAGTGLTATLLLDPLIYEAWTGRPDDGLAPLARAANLVGRPQLVVPVLGLTYGIARLENANQLSEAALHIGAGLGAAGVVNGLLKWGLGRHRPAEGGGAAEFRPLNLSDQWQSFPSGHAVVAFALAAAIDEETAGPWPAAVGYGVAAAVGWSRLHAGRHWASDVVGGAVVGTTVSRYAVRWLHTRADSEQEPGLRLALSPTGIAFTLPVR